MKKLIAIVFWLIAAWSCVDMLDTTPYDSIASGSMWTTEDLADKGIAGIFDVLYNKDMANFNPNLSSVGGINRIGIEAMGFCTSYAVADLLHSPSPSAGNAYVSREWQFGYEGIHRCNDAVANLHKAGLDEAKFERLMCEARFMRAFFYRRLNMLFRGVPIYLEPVNSSEAIREASTMDEVWEVCLDDLNYCIENPHLADNTLTQNYGRPSKGAAYALRGMVRMWTGEYAEAAKDFEKVKECGYGLWEGDYIDFFKYENEKHREMIFPLQFDEASGYCDNIQLAVGGRDHYDCWSEVIPAPDFVDYYTNSDGSAFDWNDYLPDWNVLTPVEREVFFLRDNLISNSSAYNDARGRIGGDIMDRYYLDDGNEARIVAAYSSRDPRLQQTIFTPYSTADCYSPYYNDGEPMQSKVLRWPYLDRGTDGGDMWHNRRESGYYIYRKYNETVKGRYIERLRCHNDFPLIRFTDVWLQYAEALNEENRMDQAIAVVNEIRARAGMPSIMSGGGPPNGVSSKEEMRDKIRYERRVELCLEGINYFDELRWGTYRETKFQGGESGYKSWWGNVVGNRWYWSEALTHWAVPLVETQRNPNLKPTPGWTY